MDVLKIPIDNHPFTTQLYESMIRLNINFVGRFEDIDGSSYLYAKVLTHKKPLDVYSNTSADSEHPYRYSLLVFLTS